MPVSVNDTIYNYSPKALDGKHGKWVAGIWQPYASVTEANSMINVAYRHRGLTVIINVSGVPTEYWYRDGVADANLIPRDALSTLDTETISLFGEGTPSSPLYGDTNISVQQNNAIISTSTGIYAGMVIREGVVYGGIVTWLQDYTYHVSAAGYYINGRFYESPNTIITLSDPDATFNRIDTFIVDTDGVASVLEGAPSNNPSQAPHAPATQLELSFALVETGTTEPSQLAVECLYQENVEWATASSNLTRLNPNSSTAPCAGIKTINGTSVINGDNLSLTRGSVLDLASLHQVLRLQIRSKGNWTNNRRLVFQWQLAGVNVGGSVQVGNGMYSFVSSNTVDCQYISIPISDFGLVAGNNVDRLLITAQISNGSIGFYIDNICLQGMTTPPPATAEDTNFAEDDLTATGNRTHDFNGFNLSINDIGTSLLKSETVSGAFSHLTFDETYAQLLSETTNFRMSISTQGAGKGSTVDIFSINKNDNTGGWLEVGGTTGVILGSTINGTGYNNSAPYINVASGAIRFENISEDNTALSVYALDAFGSLVTRTVASIGGGVTADNGLTENPASNIQLGGTLLQNTTINAAGFKTTFTGTIDGSAIPIVDINNSTILGGVGLKVTNSSPFQAAILASGNAYGVSASGYTGIYTNGTSIGLDAASTSGGVAFQGTVIRTSIDTVGTVSKFVMQTSGTAANGIGGSLDLQAMNVTSGVNTANQLIWKWTDATFATRTSQFEIWGVNSAVNARKLAIEGNGATTLDTYGDGIHTGTATYIAGWTVDGKFIEIDPGTLGGGGGSFEPVVTDPVEGDVIEHNGSGWVNKKQAEEVTFAQLNSKRVAATLVPGKVYLVTDFATKHYIVDQDGTQYTSGDGIITGSVEPLLVVAASTSKIHPVAKSTIYPQDIIHVDFNADNWVTDQAFGDYTNIISGWKGTIYFRHDTKLDNHAPYDFRNCKFRRWAENCTDYDDATTYAVGEIRRLPNTGMLMRCVKAGTGLILSGGWQDLVDPDDDFGTRNIMPSPVPIYNIGVDSTVYSDHLSFDVVNSKSVHIDPMYDDGNNWDYFGTILTGIVILGTAVNTQFKRGCGFMTLYSVNNSVFDNHCYGFIVYNIGNSKIGADCAWFIGYGITTSIIGSSSSQLYFRSIQDSNIGAVAYNNTISKIAGWEIGWGFENNCMQSHLIQYGNRIGNLFRQNFIYGKFEYNEIGSYCLQNTFSGDFHKNFVGADFVLNNINDNTEGNTIGSSFRGNTLSTFANNFIGGYVSGNTFQSGFASNFITNNFVGNTIGTDASYNKFMGNCGANTIGTNCMGNYFGAHSSSLVIGNNFQNNHIDDGAYGFTTQNDFSAATHVYGQYNCRISSRVDGVKRLYYTDNSNVLQNVDPTT